MADILKDGMNQLGFSVLEIERLSPMMEQYIKELVLFNSAYNLVNTDDHDEIVVRHILDSFSAVSQIKKLAQDLEHIAQKASVQDANTARLDAGALNDSGTTESGRGLIIGDIGSGGGLPGIPLASAMPEYNFVLVERMSKRCAFLENVAAILGLKNVTVKNVEAERVPAESIDIAVFRAFRPLDKKMIKTLLNMLPSGGKLAAYKAREDKIREEMSAINYQDGSYKVIPLMVPFLTDTNDKESRERNLVVVTK